MNRLQRLLALPLLTSVFRRPSPRIIKRSGEEGAAVNCFSVHIDQQGEAPLLVIDIAGETVSCLGWDGSDYTLPHELQLSQVAAKDFLIDHYYGLWDVRYKGLNDFIRGRLLLYPYIKINAVRIWNPVAQYVFNKRRLVTRHRTKLLKRIVDRHLAGNPALSSTELMIHLHNVRWIYHPAKNFYQRQLELYLDSLVESGDLQKVDGYKYLVKGKALQSLERYEEEEARHTEARRLQYVAIALSVCVVALTVVQAGLVRLPVLLDRSTPSPISADQKAQK